MENVQEFGLWENFLPAEEIAGWFPGGSLGAIVGPFCHWTVALEKAREQAAVGRWVVFYTGEADDPHAGLGEIPNVVRMGSIAPGVRRMCWPVWAHRWARLTRGREAEENGYAGRSRSISVLIGNGACWRGAGKNNTAERLEYVRVLGESSVVRFAGLMSPTMSYMGMGDVPAFVAGGMFHFAAENSLCRGYVTEKIELAWDAGSVPIYQGDGWVVDRGIINGACCLDGALPPEEIARKVRGMGEAEWVDMVSEPMCGAGMLELRERNMEEVARLVAGGF